MFGGSDEDEDKGGESRTASAAPSRRGQYRVAALDRAPTGSLPSSATSFGMNSKDAGAHSFLLADGAARSAQDSPTPALRRGPVEQPAPVVQASREPPPPSPADVARAQAEQARIQAEQAQAQQALAQAMAKQNEAKAAAPEGTPILPDGSFASAPAQVAPSPTAPMPPRRPIELASDGPSAPLPPGRPPEFAKLAGLRSDKAPGVTGPAKADGISNLIAAAVPSRTAGLPAVITAGARSELPPPQVMAFAAAPTTAAPLPPAVSRPPPRDVPLPVARPNFVAARLDRSNFRTLTGSNATTKSPGRAGIGSAVAALRPAAQSNLGMMAASASPGAGQGFKSRATDLPSDHFIGAAIKPREHVVTSAAAASGRSTAD